MKHAPLGASDRGVADALQRRLEALDYDGVAANFASIMSLEDAGPQAYESILEELDAALARERRSALLHALRGKVLLRLRRGPQARAALRRALQLDPGLRLARAWLGAALMYETKLDLASHELGRAIRSGDSYPWAFFHRATALYAQGKIAAARRDLGRALRAPSRHPAHRAATAFLALIEGGKAGRRSTALADKAVALDRRSWWPYAVRSKVHGLNGNERAELEDLNRALNRRAPSWVRLARSFLREKRGDTDGALEDVTAARACEPRDAYLRARQAKLRSRRDSWRKKRAEKAAAGLLQADDLIKSGRVEEAFAFLEARDVRDPEMIKRRLQLAQATLGLLNFGLTERLLKPVLRAFPESYEALMMRARLRMRQQRLRDAARDYETAWRLRPDRWEQGLPLAEIWLRLGDLRRMGSALRKARRAAMRRPRAQDALIVRFRIALCLGRLKEAQRLGEAVLDRALCFQDMDVLYRPPVFDLDDFRGPTPPAPAYERGIKALFEAHLASDPSSPWGCYYYRQFMEKFQKSTAWGAAPECLRRLKALPLKRYGWMRYHIGLNLLHARDFAGAVRQFTLAWRYSKGKDWRSQCHIGEAQLCLGRLDVAMKSFDLASSSAAPEHGGHIQCWKGELLLWAGEYRRASRVLDEALARHIVPLAYGWKGAALIKLGRIREGLEVLDKTVAAYGDQEARLWRGEALLRLGRLDEALLEANSAKRASGGKNFYAFVLAGLIKGAMGDPAGARDEYRRVPSRVIEHVAAGPTAAPRADAGIMRILERVLARSRGVRRGDYETAVWMRTTPSAR